MWTYLRDAGIEFGFPHQAHRMHLKPHLHTSAQIMVVTGGSRRVQLGGRAVIVPTGSMLIIPPGVAHAADGSGWDGFNAYFDHSLVPGLTASLLRFTHLPHWVNEVGKHGLECDISCILALMPEGMTAWSDPGLSPYHPESTEPAGWPQSREGQIRRYRRESGITPHAHFKAIQLDRARQKLARGEAIAAVAAELGFTDQSHLGRQFLATFGTSPGRYGSGQAGSITNVPDGHSRRS